MINTVLFDLDGTLLGMKDRDFEERYFYSLAKKFSKYNKPNELYKIIWDATIYMVRNTDGTRLNQERFFERFNDLIKPEYIDIYYNGFIEFYDKEFDHVKDATFEMKHMLEAVKILKEKGYDVLIATNPLFPEVAITKRIYWAGLSPKDFSHITNFEICRYCKPNPEFYQEILDTIGKKPEQCLMVGNDMLEDMVAKKIGISTYLVKDCIIERDITIDPDFISESIGFLRFVEELPII